MAPPKKKGADTATPGQPTAAQQLAARLAGAVGTAVGKSSVRIGVRGASDVTEAIPFGAAELDEYVTGCGGLPIGRMTEIFSEEGGGKSALLLTAAANAQRAGGLFAVADIEGTMTSERLRSYGVNPDEVVWLDTETLESTLEAMEALLDSLKPSDGPVLLALDSLAQTPSDAEVREGVIAGKKEMASDRAKVLGRAVRVLASKVANKRVALVIINQLRVTFGVSYGVPSNTPGGAAIKFYATLRLTLLGGSDIKGGGGAPIGKDLTVYCVKNKLAPSHRKARVRLMFYDGLDPEFGAIECAKTLGLPLPPYKERDSSYDAAGLAARNALAAQRAAGWPCILSPQTPLHNEDGEVLDDEPPPE